MNLIAFLTASIVALNITLTITSGLNFVDTINKKFIRKVPIKLWHSHLVSVLLLAILSLTPKPQTLNTQSSSTQSSSTQSSSTQSSSQSYESCTSYEAKSFAVKRIESTIGNLMFLDLHRDLGSKWLFYGSAYSSRDQRDVTVWVLINCNNGTYDVENVEVDA